MCDFQELFWKIKKICINRSLLPLSGTDSALFVKLYLNHFQSSIGTRSCRTFTWFKFWSFMIWIRHFDGKICDFSDPDFDCTLCNQQGEQKAVFNVYFNGEFYFGKARGHKSVESCEIYTCDRKGPISLLLSFSEVYGAPDQLLDCWKLVK